MAGDPGGVRENQKKPSDKNMSSARYGARELTRLGDICVSAASYESAVEYFSRALELISPDSAPQDRASTLRKVCYCLGKLGRNEEAEAHLREAEELSHEISDAVERARILIEKGKLAIVRGRLDAALTCAEKARELLSETSDNKERGFAENLLGNVLLRMGKVEDSKACFNKSLDYFKRAGDIRNLALAYNNLGLVFKNACDWPRALEYLQVALNLQAVEGEYHGRAQQLQNLGVIHAKMGNWKLAVECFEQCLHIGREVGDPLRVLRALIGLGNVHRLTRKWTLAGYDLEQAREILDEHLFAREEVLVEKSLGELAFDREDFASAQKFYDNAWSLANRCEAGEDLSCELLRLKAELLLAKGDAKKALPLVRNARHIAKSIGDKFEEAVSWRAVALANAALKARGEAESAFKAGADELRGIGEKHNLAWLLLENARFLLSARRAAEAAAPLSLLEEAKDLFLSLGEEYGVGMCHLEFARVDSTRGAAGAAHGHLARARELFSRGDEAGALRTVSTVQREMEERLVKTSASQLSHFQLIEKLDEISELPLGFTEKMREMLGIVSEAVGADGALIASRNEQTGSHELVCSRGIAPDTASKLMSVLASGEGILDGHEPYISLHLPSSMAIDSDVNLERQVSSFIAVPFKWLQSGTATLYVDRVKGNAAGAFLQAELNTCVGLSTKLGGVAVELKLKEKTDENFELRKKLEEDIVFGDIITQNREMLEIVRLIGKVADNPSTVLLQGETGTGKQLIARAIHLSSARRDKPFVTIDCAALPESLLESELFGYLRGSFTGADRDRKGLLQEANGGTVFLDEIGRAGLSLQRRLLRLLDSGEIRPVGSTSYVPLDVKIVCATTSSDLRRDVDEGRFLKDLYYRLNDICVSIPPLRERKEDVPLLCEHFLGVYSREMEKKIRGISKSVMATLIDMDWPGNVRELEKMIKRAVILADEGQLITSQLLPPDVAPTDKAPAVDREAELKEAVEDFEKKTIIAALEKFSWNKSRTASFLGLSRKGLKNKIRRYDLDRRSRPRTKA
ncbi:MAG: sigma 54-interacting transcriptional regulator [Candidatus Eiseniibacteriota bacterium]|nr:MAG: sigma 54-interacting transcriptional regulator [Candidatus Eisenbacteria bacterium]